MGRCYGVTWMSGKGFGGSFLSLLEACTQGGSQISYKHLHIAYIIYMSAYKVGIEHEFVQDTISQLMAQHG